VKLKKNNLNHIVDKMLLTGEAKLVPWDDRYAVTKCGEVYSRAGNRVRYSQSWRKKSFFKAGTKRSYNYCHLADEKFSYGVHTLVAKVFIGEQPEGQEVRHLDCNSFNNNLENLAYGTRKQNMQDSIKNGSISRGTSRVNSVLTEWTVRIAREMVFCGYTNTAVAAKLGVSKSTMDSVIKGKHWGWLDNYAENLAAGRYNGLLRQQRAIAFSIRAVKGHQEKARRRRL